MNEFIFKSTPEIDRILKEMIGNRIEKIVRCKDCKYWVCKEVEGHIDEHYCGLLAEDMYADDFCSRGERKDD